MVWGGTLIELVRLSGTSVVCSWTSMITLQSSSTIFLEPCFVHMTRIQFLDANSFPKMMGLVWLLQTMNFCMNEWPFMLKALSEPDRFHTCSCGRNNERTFIIC